jgi:hypothetical protein
LIVTRPLGRDEHAIPERLADVVVRRCAARVNHPDREQRAVPRQEHEATSVGREREETEGHVEVQTRVQELGAKVVGEVVGVSTERVYLPTTTPNFSLKNCMNVRFMRPVFSSLDLGPSPLR